jgi:hypothetical protein
LRSSSHGFSHDWPGVRFFPTDPSGGQARFPTVFRLSASGPVSEFSHPPGGRPISSLGALTAISAVLELQSAPQLPATPKPCGQALPSWQAARGFGNEPRAVLHLRQGAPGSNRSCSRAFRARLFWAVARLSQVIRRRFGTDGQPGSRTRVRPVQLRPFEDRSSANRP